MSTIPCGLIEEEIEKLVSNREDSTWSEKSLGTLEMFEENRNLVLRATKKLFVNNHQSETGGI